jgi:hypothetical protein
VVKPQKAFPEGHEAGNLQNTMRGVMMEFNLIKIQQLAKEGAHREGNSPYQEA